MSTCTLTATLDRGHDETVAATREALAEQGFGILTEIDLRATLKENRARGHRGSAGGRRRGLSRLEAALSSLDGAAR